MGQNTKNRVLTGITTTGTPHLGNYVGAIRPAIKASENDNNDSYYFLANYHALIKCQDGEAVHRSTQEIAATWLAFGLNPEKVTFYRQSDILEIPELTWILNCVCAKGLMNRAHAYKAAVDENLAENEDADKAVTMGLFSYPVLMAADILMFSANQVPVGRDQIQHVEMARDLAQRFNHLYASKKQPIMTLPDYQVEAQGSVLKGLDGRKMSKSYGNTIPLFLTEKQLQKHINKIKTNLLEPGEPKETQDSSVFQIYQAFGSAQQIEEMRQAFADGIGWGEAKKQLFAVVNDALGEARENYHELMQKPDDIEDILQAGAKKARLQAANMMERVRASVGIHRLK